MGDLILNITERCPRCQGWLCFYRTLSPGIYRAECHNYYEAEDFRGEIRYIRCKFIGIYDKKTGVLHEFSGTDN